MVRRKARRGPWNGREFFGCSQYPKCPGLRNIDGPKHWTEVRAEIMSAVTRATEPSELLELLRAHRESDSDLTYRMVVEYADEIDESVVDEVMDVFPNLASDLAVHPSCYGECGEHLAYRVVQHLESIGEGYYGREGCQKALLELIKRGVLSRQHPLVGRIYSSLGSGQISGLSCAAPDILLVFPSLPEDWLLEIAPRLCNGAAVRHPAATKQVFRASLIGPTYCVTTDKVEALLERREVLEDPELRLHLAPHLGLTDRKELLEAYGAAANEADIQACRKHLVHEPEKLDVILRSASSEARMITIGHIHFVVRTTNH